MTAKKKKSVKIPESIQDQQIDQAVSILQQGGVIAYPTEAVYGLGCDPNNLSAVKNILSLKKRDKNKGLILVAANFEQLKPYLQSLEKEIEKKLHESWQGSLNSPASTGAVTWIVPAKKTTSTYLKGQFNTLAVRVSHHPVVKKLCEKFNGAIVSTSANISNREAARTSEQVKNIFFDDIDMIVEGKTDLNALPSEIRDALTDQVIRSAS